MNSEVFTETVETRHGSFEYDATTCDHCETTIPVDEGIRYAIEPTVGRIRLHGDDVVEANGAGYLCKYCSESLFGWSGGKIEEKIPIQREMGDYWISMGKTGLGFILLMWSFLLIGFFCLLVGFGFIPGA